MWPVLCRWRCASIELASAAGSPLAQQVLARRLDRGKEHPERLAERRGEATIPRPNGPLIWVHGASVGEMLAVVPLIERLRAQDFAVLVTSGTVTSAALAEQRLPDGTLHQFIPLDAPRFVRRFLDHWQPGLALFVESDLWPNLILSCAERKIPMILVNGRLSERSFSRWRLFPGTIAALLGRFDMCLAQSAADAERYAQLGAPRVMLTGNLKLDVPAPPVDPATLKRLKEIIGMRPVIAAASTHAGEETAIDRRAWPTARQIPEAVDRDRATPSEPRRSHRRTRQGRRTDRGAALAARPADAGCRDLYRRHAGRARPDLSDCADRVHGRLAGEPRRPEPDRSGAARRRRAARAACMELRRNLRDARRRAWRRTRGRRSGARRAPWRLAHGCGGAHDRRR